MDAQLGGVITALPLGFGEDMTFDVGLAAAATEAAACACSKLVYECDLFIEPPVESDCNGFIIVACPCCCKWVCNVA